MRAALPDDAAAVVALLNRVGGESDNLLFGANGFPLSTEEEQAHIAARQEGSPSVLLLGFAGDEFVSVGSIEVPHRARLAHTGELALSVSKSHWGQGVASAMMTALLAHARGVDGLCLLHLGVRADNTRAIRLYKRFGFVNSGTFPGFIQIGGQRHDEIIMTLELGQDKQSLPGGTVTFREAALPDLPALLTLYRDLLDETPLTPEEALPIWRSILSDPDQCVILGECGGEIVASCVLVVAANLTRGGQPWAVVENVVTAKAHRRKGYGLALLGEAKRIALGRNCYKIMLLTGRRDEGTLAFYSRAGYNQNDKTAFIQRL